MTYVSNTNICTLLSEQTVDLGTSADSDLQSQLSSNWFGVGIKWTTETGYGSTTKIYTSDNSITTLSPILIVTYTPT